MESHWAWGWFSLHLVPRLESYQIESLGIGSVDFLTQGWKVIKWGLLGFVLSISGAKASKSTQNCFPNNWSVAAVTSQKLVLPAESVLHEV